MSDEAQALCFLAGANSIFVGSKLLTTPNPAPSRDQALLARLGMSCETARSRSGPLRAGSRATVRRHAAAGRSASASRPSQCATAGAPVNGQLTASRAKCFHPAQPQEIHVHGNPSARSDRDRRHGPHGHGQLPRRARATDRAAARQRRDQGRHRAGGRAAAGRERSADGVRAAGGSGPGAGPAGFDRRRRSQHRAVHHGQQDVRLRHEDGDAGVRRPARETHRHRGRRRHGEHDQRTLPAAQDARRRPARPRRGQGPHVPRRPGGRLRQRPPDGHLRGGHRAALSVHARGAGRVRGREPEARPRRPTRTGPSPRRWWRSP